MASTILPDAARIATASCQIDIDAPRPECYRAFLEDVAEWFFESEQTRRSRPARLEPSLGGRFYVEHDNGDLNLLAIVTLLRRDRKVRLRGDFTMPQALTANVTVSFDDAGDGTRITVDHRMCGEFDDDLPAEFEAGWLDGLQKLKAHVEGT